MSAKKTQQEMIKWIREKRGDEFTPVGIKDYKGVNSKILFRHVSCGHEYEYPGEYGKGNRVPGLFEEEEDILRHEEGHQQSQARSFGTDLR